MASIVNITMLISMIEGNRTGSDPFRQNHAKAFAACGTKDVYYQCSKVVVDAFRDLSVPMNYFEDEGAHDWDTWDRYLIQALDWIRL